MTFSLLGYLPKERILARTLDPAWLAGATTEEVCSVSTCLASAPPDWIDLWVHNDWGFCNTIEAARSLIPPGTADYDLYAFAVSSTRYRDGQPETVDVKIAFGTHVDNPPEPEALPDTFFSLGFDAVSNSLSAYFECSPLSCNKMAEVIAVNRYCLLDEPDQAAEAARRFSVEQPESGVYYVVQVFRAARS
jgi:hypothetical protein